MTSGTKTFRVRVQKEDEEFFAEHFRSRGYICTKLDTDNQDKPSDRPETPDFLLEKKGIKIYCEIKSMFEKEDYTKSNEILKRLANRLEKLNHSFDFDLGISDKLTKLLSEREKEMGNFVNNTIKNLNSNLSLPFLIKDKSKEFQVKLTSKNNLRHLRCCLMYSLRGREPKNSERIGNYIKDSVSKFKDYSSKGNSFVLIVFNRNIFLDIRPIAFYAELEGILTPDKNTTISAIALCVRRERFIVFHNPYTKYPLAPKIFANKDNEQYKPKEIKSNGIEFVFVESK